MEEILASIRRLIADDDAMPGAYRDVRRRARVDVDAAPPARSAYPAPVLGRRQDEQPLSADESGGEIGEAGAVRLLYGADAAGQAIEESSDAESPSGNERVTEQANSGVRIADSASDGDGSLLSSEAGAAVASRFQALAAGVAFSETDILDRCAQEMLRPMVEQWLNEHLPSLVERLVRGEIERITRAGGRASASGAKATQP